MGTKHNSGGALSIGPFELTRSRLRGMRLYGSCFGFLRLCRVDVEETGEVATGIMDGDEGDIPLWACVERSFAFER